MLDLFCRALILQICNHSTLANYLDQGLPKFVTVGQVTERITSADHIILLNTCMAKQNKALRERCEPGKNKIQ